MGGILQICYLLLQNIAHFLIAIFLIARFHLPSRIHLLPLAYPIATCLPNQSQI